MQLCASGGAQISGVRDLEVTNALESSMTKSALMELAPSSLTLVKVFFHSSLRFGLGQLWYEDEVLIFFHSLGMTQTEDIAQKVKVFHRKPELPPLALWRYSPLGA